MIVEDVFVLIAIHLLCDFALQDNWMARKKNRKIDLADKSDAKGIHMGKPYQLTWFYYLLAHSMIHGLGVFIYGGLIPAVITAITHFFIDMLKTNGGINIHQDQLLHLLVILFNVGWFLYA